MLKSRVGRDRLASDANIARLCSEATVSIDAKRLQQELEQEFRQLVHQLGIALLESWSRSSGRPARAGRGSGRLGR